MIRYAMHIFNDFVTAYRDPLWGHIYIHPAYNAIINTPEYQRLHRIKQLGPSYLVYPGATHSRFNHSLGVLSIGKRMLAVLNPQLDLSAEEAHVFLLACLLHDIGHFPYTHSLKELPLREHEELSSWTILNSEIAGICKNELRIDPEYVAAVIDHEMIYTAPRLELFRNMLSGVLDPDKLDYLNRDAYFCGVPYGIQDLDFILSRLIITDNKLSVKNDGIRAIEHLLFAKYLMYGAVYWHPQVRSATSMIKHALFTGIEDGSIAPENLYFLDDQAFYTGLAEKSPLIKRVFQGQLYSPVLTVPFDTEKHNYLMNLESRNKKEAELKSRFSEDLIIDIPEAISFETDIPALLENPSVFSQATVQQFTHCLRYIRVFCPEMPDISITPGDLED